MNFHTEADGKRNSALLRLCFGKRTREQQQGFVEGYAAGMKDAEKEQGG